MNKQELDFKISLQNNIGLIKAGIWNGTPIGMTFGGTGTKLVPVVGGVVVSASDKLEIVGPGVSGQMLVSAGSSKSPKWVDAPELPKPGNWGSFWDNTNQPAVANVPQAMLLCVTDPASVGVFTAEGSKVYFETAGVYNIQFSAQFKNVTNNVVHDVTIWLRLNGVDVPDTAGFVSVDGQHTSVPGTAIVSWNYMMSLAAGDYVELWWHNDHADLSLATLPAGTSPVHPVSPAVIFTAQQVMHTQATSILGGSGGVTSVNGLDGVVTGIATTAGNLSQFGATTSAQLASVLTDEIGTGRAVFATNTTLTNPVMTTPTLGIAAATSVNNITITAPVVGATLTIDGGLLFRASGTDITLNGSGLASNVTLPSTGTLATLAGTETLSGKTLSSVILGTPASGTLTNCTGLPNSGTTASSTSSPDTIVLRNASQDTAVRDLGCRDTNASRNVNCDTLNAVSLVSAPAVAATTNVTINGKVLDTIATNMCLTLPAGKGIIPAIQIICPSAATSLSNVNTLQNAFSPTGYDVISVQALTTYMFDGQYIIGSGTTSHSTAMSFALNGGATVNNVTWTTLTTAFPTIGTSSTTQATNLFISVAGGACNAANTNATCVIKFEGIMRINASGGTVTPQITFSAAPGGTNQMLIGSYLKFYPIGANTVNSVGTAII